MKQLIKRMNAKKNNKGFTLVELIIVIAIIAVLAAVLAPQYVKYVERSRQGVDASTLEEVKHNVEIQAGISEGLTAGTVTITGSTGAIAGVTTNINMINITDVIGATSVTLKSAAAKTYTYTMDVSADGKVTWQTATQTNITALQGGTLAKAAG